MGRELTTSVSPFGQIDGTYVSLDGVDAGRIEETDVEDVLHQGDNGNDVAAVMVLKDGRYCGFETFYDVTGDGFHEDAYGGGAELAFARDIDTVIRLALTDAGRRLCGIEQPE